MMTKRTRLSIFIALSLLSGVALVYIAMAYAAPSRQTPNRSGNTSQTPAPTEYVAFNELGFKIPVSGTMRDWSYMPVPGYPESRAVHSQAHDKQIEQCRSGNGEASEANDPADKSFASFTKVNGVHQKSDHELEQVVKQFDSFYITITTPNFASCTNPDFKGSTDKTPPEMLDTLKRSLEGAVKL